MQTEEEQEGVCVCVRARARVCVCVQKALLSKGNGWGVVPAGQGSWVGPELNFDLSLKPCGWG